MSAFLEQIQLDAYLSQLKHSINRPEDSEELPRTLLTEWTRKDIDEVVLRLGGFLDQRYRKLAVLSVPGATGATYSGVAHSSGAVNLTGFSGLTVNEYANCAIIYVGSSLIYYAGIKSNTADTVVLDKGGALPVIVSGDIFITKITTGGQADLNSLRGFENGDRIWSVVGLNGKSIPKISVDLSQDIQNMADYNNSVYWYQLGDQLYFVVGANTVWPGAAEVGFYRLPYPASDDSDYIDLPIEYHSLAQAQTNVRMLTKIDRIAEATLDGSIIQADFRRIEKGSMAMKGIDWLFGERVK